MPPLQIRKSVAIAVKKAKRCRHLSDRWSMTVAGIEVGSATCVNSKKEAGGQRLPLQE
jgi:hypothetical protein